MPDENPDHGAVVFGAPFTAGSGGYALNAEAYLKFTEYLEQQGKTDWLSLWITQEGAVYFLFEGRL